MLCSFQSFLSTSWPTFHIPESPPLEKFKSGLLNAAGCVHFKIPEFTVLFYSELAEINLTWASARAGVGGGDGGGGEIHSFRANIEDKHEQRVQTGSSAVAQVRR